MKVILKAAIADVSRDKTHQPADAALAYRPPGECGAGQHAYVCEGYVMTCITRYRCSRCGAWYDVDSSD